MDGNQRAKIAPTIKAFGAAIVLLYSGAVLANASAPDSTGTEMAVDIKIEPLDPNLLKAMLPASLPGLKRALIAADKTVIGGFGVSKAIAAYTNDQGGSIDLAITDIGGNKTFGPLAAWGSVDARKETESGYEKTTMLDGRLTHEKFNKNGPTAEFAVLVAGRFLIETRGHKLDLSMLKEVVNGLDLKKLEAVKKPPVKP